MRNRIRLALTAILLALESDLLDIRIWALRRIDQLLKRQITLLKAAVLYIRKGEP